MSFAGILLGILGFFAAIFGLLIVYLLFCVKYKIDMNRFAPDESKMYDQLQKALTQQTLEINGARLYVYECGPKDGRLIIFLHGFPEIALTAWKHQLLFFAKRGFRVCAFDLRGFGESRVRKTHHAHPFLAAHDVAYLIKFYYKREKAIVVGHDWGANVAWVHSFLFPEQVEKLVSVNMPHPAVFKKRLTSSCAQIKKSWYIFLFQIRFVAEMFLRKNDFAPLVAVLQKDAKAFSREDVQKLKQMWRNTISSQLEYYRSIFKKPDYKQIDKAFEKRKQNFTVKHPVLILFGKLDTAIGYEMVNPSLNKKYCENGKAKFYDDASHWLQHEKPNEVNQDILEFVTDDAAK